MSTSGPNGVAGLWPALDRALTQGQIGGMALQDKQREQTQKNSSMDALAALLPGITDSKGITWDTARPMDQAEEKQTALRAFPEQAAQALQNRVFPAPPKQTIYKPGEIGGLTSADGTFKPTFSAPFEPPKIPDILVPGVLAAEIKKANASRVPEKPLGVGDVFKNKFGSDVPKDFMPELGPSGVPTGKTMPIPGSPADPAVAEQKRVADLTVSLPKAQGAMNSALGEFDKTIGIIDDILQPENDTGLGDVTGFGGTGTGKFLTMAGGDAARVQSKIDQLKGRAFLSGLATLKAASANGSTGLGATSETEGKKVQDAQAALEQAQSEDDFKAALLNYKKALVEAKSNIGSTFRSEYAPAFKGTGTNYVEKYGLQ